MARHERMYKDSPRLDRDEDGKMGIKKGPSEDEKKSSRTSDGTQGMEIHERHASERREMKHRHIGEHLAMHHRHELEHAHHKHGSKELLHERHERELKEMHGRHESEDKSMHDRHEKEETGGAMIKKVEKNEKE